MQKSHRSLIRSTLLGCTAIPAGMLVCVAQTSAQEVVPETVVITGTLFNPDVAPAKVSINTKQPETIIGRSYIDDSVAPQADYVTILAITPSLTGTDINGPGLSEGNVKNTLRGLPDGNYGMTYDGIPFGDTNGPSHHSASYFPGTTIGSIDVERGPGNAGNLGPATYGGSINMFSEPVADNTRLKGALGYGSFDTSFVNLNVQTGDIRGLGDTKLLFNLQQTSTDGALTFQTTKQNTALVKIESQLSPDWTFTAFGTYTAVHLNQNDSNGATPSQVAAFGKKFALQNTDPTLPTYAPYNITRKWTDMDYVRIRGTITDELKVDEQVYTYAYVNNTFSPRSILSTFNSGTGVTTYTGMGGSLAPIVNGVKQANDIPAYTKLNAYRVWGSIFRASEDYQFGSITGQVRAGLWVETAATPRARYDFDSNKCFAASINPFDNPSEAAAICQDSSLVATKKAVKTSAGFAEYDEHSSWRQYQPFVEVDIHPIEELTLTPGFKYVNWTHSTRSVVEPKLLTPLQASFKTTRALPFLEANYKIEPFWSVYAQYAQGIYVPDINAFEQSSTVLTYPKAQTSTNYQVGTVYYADKFTVDGDVYYIPVNNNIVFQDCSLAPIFGIKGDTCGVNTGQALYKGIEAEATYTFGDDIMSGALSGFTVFVNGSVNSGKSSGLYVKQAPMWTSAGGIIYKHNNIKFSLIDKMVGPQYSDIANNPNYKVHAYNNMDITIGYDFGALEASFGVFNVLGTRDILAITENDKVFQANRLLSTDQYFFQPVRSFMFTLKAHT